MPGAQIITFLELENFKSKEEALLAILGDLEGNMSSEKLMDAANIAKALSQEKSKLLCEKKIYWQKEKSGKKRRIGLLKKTTH